MNDFRIKEFVPKLSDIAEYLWTYPHENGWSAEQVYAELVGLGRSQNIQCGFLSMTQSGVEVYAYRPEKKFFSWRKDRIVKAMEQVKQLDLFNSK